MEWVRGQYKSNYRGEDGKVWNQEVMKKIGKGPKPPEDVEDGGHVTADEARIYKFKAIQRMRITCGYRVGCIAGGPQGEKPMINP